MAQHKRIHQECQTSECNLERLQHIRTVHLGRLLFSPTRAILRYLDLWNIKLFNNNPTVSKHFHWSQVQDLWISIH